MLLRDSAHARAGDKGNISTISVIANRSGDYETLWQAVTAEKVLALFAPLGATGAERYELPKLAALNFVLTGTLGGGVTRSLALDAHGKALSGLLLELEV